MSKSNEPIFWSLFAAGGVVAALFIPILMVITGLILPFNDKPFAYERIHGAVSHPLIRLLLFILIALPLFHWAHRFRFVLIDIGLKEARGIISVLCYGGAIVGTIVTAVLLLWF